MASKKSAPKALVVNPQVDLNTKNVVKVNRGETMHTITIQIPIGAPKELDRPNGGGKYLRCGSVSFPRGFVVEIDGVKYSLGTTAKKWNGKGYSGVDSIYLKPYVEREETDENGEVVEMPSIG